MSTWGFLFVCFFQIANIYQILLLGIFLFQIHIPQGTGDPFPSF